jgi:hypothetical protein
MTPEGAPGPRRNRAFAWRRFGPACVLLISAPLLGRIYTMNPVLGLASETVSAGLTAHSVVREGNVGLREYYPAARPGDDLGYALRWKGDRLYGMEFLASPLTFAPFYLPYRRDPAPPAIPWTTFGVVAARVATVAIVVLGLWLLRVTSPAWALVVTATIALGTCYRTITAAGLWTHTSATFWLVPGLALWWTAPRRPVLYPLAGAALAAATACRPVLAPAAALVAADACVRWRAHRAVALATAALVVGIGAFAAYANWHFHGSLFGGRAGFVQDITRTHNVPTYFRFSPVHLAALLVAPSRGLFVYSPVLLFALPGLARSLGAAAPAPARLMTVAGLGTFFLYGFIATWWGGWVFGPRYMADLLPFFALWLALTPCPRRARSAAGVLFVVALGWSLWVPQVAARAYPCGWNETPRSIDAAPERLWDWRDTEIARCARARAWVAWPW